MASDYFDNPRMSQSKMKDLLISPRYYYLKHIAKVIVDEERSNSLQLGTCIDLALTDVEAYNNLKIKNTKTTNVEGYITAHWKEQIDKWRENLYNYTFEDDYFGSYNFKIITKQCTLQEELYYNYNNIKWKAKLDYLSKDKNFFIDLKSTRRTTFEDFLKDFYNFGYYFQASSYAIAIKKTFNLNYYPTAYYVAISTVTGEVFAIRVSNEAIYIGIKEIDYGCKLYNDNIITQNWAKNQKVVEIGLPVWLQAKINNYNNKGDL